MFHIICLTFNRPFLVPLIWSPNSKLGLEAKIGRISLDSGFFSSQPWARLQQFGLGLSQPGNGVRMQENSLDRKHLVRNLLTFSRPGKIRARRQAGKRPGGGLGFQKAAVLGGDIAAACFASISATVPQRDASAF